MTDTTDTAHAGWMCTGCKKVTSSQPVGQCADCGGEFRPATDADLECDRCSAEYGRRLLDRTGEYDRLCPSCIDEVLFA